MGTYCLMGTVSVVEEQVLEKDSGGGCTTLGMGLMLLN